MSAPLTHNEPPLVSVVVPTYNRRHLLPETVNAILAQTFANFELIIVDNMSEDGTDQYVSSIQDPRIRYYRNPNHGVIAVNRNCGLRQAQGQYVALCDDDDLWLPDKLEKQVAVMERFREIALCYTNGLVFDGVREVRPWLMRKKVFKNHFHALLRGNFIPNSSVLIRSSVLKDVGWLNEAPEIRTAEDYDLWIRIAAKYPIHYLDERLIKYRVHATNNMGSRASSAVLNMALLKKHKNMIPAYSFCVALLIQKIRKLYFSRKKHMFCLA